MPDRYINGIQLIRDRDYYTAPQPTVTIPANGEIIWTNYALLYVGINQNNNATVYINDNTGQPLYKLECSVTDETRTDIKLKKISSDEVVASTFANHTSGIWAVGFVNDNTQFDGWKIALGTNRVMQWYDDELQPIHRTGYDLGLSGGNTIYFKNLGDEPLTIETNEHQINADSYLSDEEITTFESTFTNSANADPTPEKSTDTSDLDPRGGGGTETNRSDTIGTPDNTAELNNYSGISAGFISLYSPSTSQLRSLASYLWTSDFVDNVKKMFGDPMDVIIGLTQLPFSVPTGASTTVKAGFIDTGIAMPRVSQQYIDFNMGSIRYGSYWGNALDFDPYTKVQIYLPFIGFRTLNTNDVINSTVSLKYRVDCLTGALTAWVSSGSFVKYEFSGQCGASIPVTSQNYNNVINTAINIVSTVGTGIIGGVATGGLGTMASMATVNGISNVASGIASGGMKPTVQRSGGMGGASSLMGMRTPYLVFQRPKTSLPGNYNNLYGYACNKYLKLGNCRGFTQVEHMRLQVQGATDDEKKEIENILHKGVFI
jgi:hypothetical protein